jgi:hypothetical protein
MRGFGVVTAMLCLLMVGCQRQTLPSPSYARALEPVRDPEQVSDRIRPPTGACLERARQHMSAETRMLGSPLDRAVADRMDGVIGGLHPAAKRVLHRINGIWFVENLKGASAVFLPCDLDQDEATGGFILVDLGAFPLDEPTRDAMVPARYWRTLAGPTTGRRVEPYRIASLDPSVPTPPDHAVRYLILHELGHALSLFAKEFLLDEDMSTRVARMDGFAGFSWKFVTTERQQDVGEEQGALLRMVIPSVSLDTFQWGSVLSVLDADAAILAPGYTSSTMKEPMTRALYVCSAAASLPGAGFVTPTAARYPTEDYAEMFAHAILADEGKIHPADMVPVDLPLCSVTELPSPYFSEAVLPKRRYMERVLGIRFRY